MRALVIGYGNPLRGDDGLGWRVADELETCLEPGEATVLACHQLTPELAAPIAKADLVVFVDARVGERPGRVAVERVEAGGIDGWSFSHHLTPAALVTMAATLYGRQPTARVVSVEAAAFDDSVVLSAAVEAAVPAAVRCVQALIWRHHARARGRRGDGHLAVGGAGSQRH